jgi:peptidyl-tRNA hydrolase
VGVIGKYRKANEVLFRMWERHGQPKIALKIQNEEHMVGAGCQQQQQQQQQRAGAQHACNTKHGVCSVNVTLLCAGGIKSATCIHKL